MRAAPTTSPTSRRNGWHALNPACYFMEIARSVFLKGTGFAERWPQMAASAVLGATVLGLAALRFHKRLD